MLDREYSRVMSKIKSGEVLGALSSLRPDQYDFAPEDHLIDKDYTQAISLSLIYLEILIQFGHPVADTYTS